MLYLLDIAFFDSFGVARASVKFSVCRTEAHIRFSKRVSRPDAFLIAAIYRILAIFVIIYNVLTA